jgi:hypothetical protein
MDIKQDQAIKRLLKKLSALRATLTNDERSVLDGLVLGSVSEVETHSMNISAARPASKPMARAAADEVRANSMNVSAARPASKPAARAAADEVSAHSMNVSAARSASKPAARAAADEVSAHSMENERPVQERSIGRVAFDPIKEEYQRIP